MEIMATSKNYGKKKVRITSGIFWTLMGNNLFMEKSKLNVFFFSIILSVTIYLCLALYFVQFKASLNQTNCCPILSQVIPTFAGSGCVRLSWKTRQCIWLVAVTRSLRFDVVPSHMPFPKVCELLRMFFVKILGYILCYSIATWATARIRTFKVMNGGRTLLGSSWRRDVGCVERLTMIGYTQLHLAPEYDKGQKRLVQSWVCE